MHLRHRLLLVRHGQAESNQRGAFLGRRDDPLTSTGRAQAEALRDRIAEDSVDRIVTSPLIRARATAELIARDKGLPLLEDNRLVEQDYGSWDGLTFPSVREERAIEFTEWLKGDPNYCPGGGESISDVCERITGCYASLIEYLDEGATLMLVGHAGASQALICHLLNVPLRSQWPFMIAPGTLAEVQVYEYGARLTRLSW